MWCRESPQGGRSSSRDTHLRRRARKRARKPPRCAAGLLRLELQQRGLNALRIWLLLWMGLLGLLGLLCCAHRDLRVQQRAMA
jgi:hypothetical protein